MPNLVGNQVGPEIRKVRPDHRVSGQDMVASCTEHEADQKVRPCVAHSKEREESENCGIVRPVKEM